MLYIPESHWTMDHRISFKSLLSAKTWSVCAELFGCFSIRTCMGVDSYRITPIHLDSCSPRAWFQLDSYLYQSYLYNQLVMYCIPVIEIICIHFVSKHWVSILVRSWTRWVPSRFWASARCWTAAAATRRPAAPPSRRPPRWWWRSRRVGFICWTSSPRIQCLGETEPEEFNYIVLYHKYIYIYRYNI